MNDRRVSLLARWRAEALLVASGLEDAVARRHAGWLARSASIEPNVSLLDLVASIDLAQLEPRALHAHALLLAAMSAQGASPAILERLVETWRRLGQAASYLDALATRAGIAPDRQRAVLENVPALAIAHLRAVADAASDGDARAAMRVLRATTSPDALGAAARLASDALVRAALNRFDEGIHGLDDVPLAGQVAVFEEARRAEARLDGDPLFRRHVVTAFLPIAWRPYTARRWDDLRALLRPMEPLSEGLASELEAAPDDLPYRAAASQLLVFRAEMASTLTKQIQLSERALAICPTLRNARVVLAAHLVSRAEHTRARDPEAADADLSRALTLDPFQRRAQALRSR